MKLCCLTEGRSEERQEGSAGDGPENNTQYTTVYVGNLAHQVRTMSECTQSTSDETVCQMYPAQSRESNCYERPSYHSAKLCWMFTENSGRRVQDDMIPYFWLNKSLVDAALGQYGRQVSYNVRDTKGPQAMICKCALNYDVIVEIEQFHNQFMVLNCDLLRAGNTSRASPTVPLSRSWCDRGRASAEGQGLWFRKVPYS